MAEPTNEVVEEVEQQEQKQELDYKSLYEETTKKLDAVVAHKDQLYSETKKAKAEREKATAEAKRIADEQAKKNGEFEKLWQSAAKEKEELTIQLQQLKTGYRQEKIDVTAMRVATELADGENAELLSYFIKQNLSSLADDDGSLSEDVIKAVAEEFKKNQKYRALLRSSKAVGGGAPGNTRGVSDPKTMSRAEFASLPPVKQMEFKDQIKKGQATLID